MMPLAPLAISAFSGLVTASQNVSFWRIADVRARRSERPLPPVLSKPSHLRMAASPCIADIQSARCNRQPCCDGQAKGPEARLRRARAFGK